jgi:hypothetical protein
MAVNFETNLEKKHFFLFSTAYLLEIQSNYASTKQKNLILNSKQILLNYLNLVLLLISNNKDHANLLAVQPLAKFNKEISTFLNTFEKDYKNKKKFFLLLEEIEENYNYFVYNQFIKSLNSLSQLIEIFINTSMDVIKLKNKQKPLLVMVNNQKSILEIEISNSFLKEQFMIMEGLKEFIISKFNLSQPKNNEIDIYFSQFYKINKISENEIFSQINEDYLQKEDLLKVIDKETYLVDDFVNLLKSVSKGPFEKNTDFFINLLNFKREENFRNLIISAKYKDFSDYLLMNFVNNGELVYKDFLKTPYYTQVINNLCENGFLVQVSGTNYWTREKLLNSIFNQDSLNEFYRTIDRFIDKEGFISNNQIASMLQDHFNNFKNPSLLIESLLLNGKNKKYEKFAFSEGKLYSRKEFRLSKLDLIKSFFKGVHSFNLYDVIDKIQNKYGIVYKDSLLLNDIKGSGLFYSEETERLYLDKQTFIKEIFKNGK